MEWIPNVLAPREFELKEMASLGPDDWANSEPMTSSEPDADLSS